MYPKPLLTYDTSIDNCPTRTFFFTSSNSSASSEIVPNYTDGGIVDLYHTAFLLVPVTGFVISLVVGSIVSLATMGHKKMKQVPSNYLSPIVYFLYPHSWLSPRRRPSNFSGKSVEFPPTFIVLDKIERENNSTRNGYPKV